MKTTTGVILAAGKGERLDRNDAPKPLVRVGSTPLILQNIMQMQEAGISTIYIVVGYRGDEIRKELTGNPHVSAVLYFVTQEISSKTGLLTSILALVGKVKGPFFLGMADLVLGANPYRLFDLGQEVVDPAIFSLVSADKKINASAGATSYVSIEGNHITHITKEETDNLEVGVYYFSEHALDHIHTLYAETDIQEFQQALEDAIKRKCFFVQFFPFGTEWFDVNTPAVYIRAELFLRHRHVAPTLPEKHVLREPAETFAFYREKFLCSSIVIERGLVSSLASLRIIPEYAVSSPHYLITDSIVDLHYGDVVLQGLRAAGYQVEKIVIEAGEHTKNIQEYSRLADEIFSQGIDKKSFLISLGGGVVNNITGFLASTLYRGIGLIHFPTSMMAQVDAAIDFKQAVNSGKGKNLFGSYYPATSIFIDPEVLITLDERHIQNGISESIKHALAQSSEFYEYLINHKETYRNIDFLDYVVRKSIELKVPLLNGDVHNDYNEMVPQYGHSIGHAIEHLSAYDFLHGESIAIGMCVSAEIAKILQLCTEDVVFAHYALFEAYGLPTTIPEHIKTDDLLLTIKYDKHYLKGNPEMALVDHIGSVWEEKGRYGIPIDDALLRQAIILNRGRRSI